MNTKMYSLRRATPSAAHLLWNMKSTPGSHRLRMVIHSMKAIQDKWPVHSGSIRVRILGEAKDLPSDLQAIVEATGPDECIEGSVLVDLCMQRSGRRESGCDAPNTSEKLPTPVASSPKSPTPPAAQVRQYSWRHYAKKKVCLYDIRWEFVGANKQTNLASPFLSQQAPLVADGCSQESREKGTN